MKIERSGRKQPGPPVFGKEANVIKKICLAIFSVLCAINIYAIDISVNSEPWRSFGQDELKRLSFPLGTAGNTSGVSLADISPLMFDAWAVEISSKSSGRHLIEIPDLADLMQEIFIITSDGGAGLSLSGIKIGDIESIDIRGEVLAKRPLEIWLNWEGTDLLREEISRWAELHGVEVKITEVPRPDSKLISITRGGGNVPDVIMVQSSYMDGLVRSGSIQNLDFMYPEGLQPQGKEAFSLDSSVWAIPFYYDAQLFFFNPELIESPGSDWTLADYEHLARRAAGLGVIPSAWNAYSGSFLIPFQMSFGKDRLINEDGSITITDGPSQKALEYIISLQDEGLMTPMERDAMTSLFVSGDAAMIISASYSIPHFEKLGIPFRALPLPVNQETGRRVSPLLDFKAFAVTKRSRNTAGARRLIEYLCGTGVQQRFTSTVSKIPARSAVFSLSAESNAYYSQLRISADSGTIIPTDKAYSVYKNTMWKMLRFALSGRMQPAQVLQKTQELVDKNLEYN